ncbi:MAG: HDOD domain-containing protein [Gammaproteobacteria bacterium]|nr:HDOD domain-containing protein [Gammaproteobacteria bacterium]
MKPIESNPAGAIRHFIQDIASHISMPEVYLQIRYLIEQENSGIDDFVEVIKKDPMLTTKLTEISNSQYFGFPRRSKNIYQSIGMIGFMQLHDLMLNSLLLRTFSAIPHQIFNMEEYWRYSVSCGIAARTIAQYCQLLPINPYFTYGLLHEIGHAAMFAKKPELSLQTLGYGDGTPTAQIDRERELFGFDYTQLGTAMVRQWRLPTVYQQVTSYHLQADLADENYRQVVLVTQLAHFVCQAEDTNNIQQLLQEIKATDHQLNKLPENIVEIIEKEIEINTGPVLDILWPSYARKTSLPLTSLS